MQRVRRILVVNGKGGCGKTTIATNLAVAYSKAGKQVALIDQDQQGSSAEWHRVRSEQHEDIRLIEAYRREGMYETRTFQTRMPGDIERVIMDTTSVGHSHDLEVLIKNADIILVPMMASAIDMRVSMRFLTDLVTHRAFRARPRAVGVVVNRVHAERGLPESVEHFLSCADIPHVATLHDDRGYSDAAELGCGISELASQSRAESLAREQAALETIMEWVDEQPICSRVTVAALRQRPLGAKRQGTQQDSDTAARA
ncbi:MAG: ParA family protein [Pseudomonadaceae bacterium]|nr:ParA family protein [Pseudomonadaceae bacterium]